MLAWLCLALSACRQETPCFERDRLQAEMSVRGGGLAARGRVTFARPLASGGGTLQFDVERDGHLDNATLLASGATAAFTDGVPRSATAAERRLLTALAVAFGWPGQSGARDLDATNRAVVTLRDGAVFEIELLGEGPAKRSHPGG